VRFCAASDQALLVYFGDELSPAAHKRILKLLRKLEQGPPGWLRNLQPAYTSLMITFDLCKVSPSDVEAAIRKIDESAGAPRRGKTRTVEIPVCYDGECGPDLEAVARMHGLQPSEVVSLHTSRTYQAYFLGFAPGFAYLGKLPEQIATPRLESPRRQVPAGSVGIAERQTGVYPFATPGGWQLIGRTALPMFQCDRRPMALIAIGDQVRFRSISHEELVKGLR
jgi:inhibitor of KinA